MKTIYRSITIQIIGHAVNTKWDAWKQEKEEEVLNERKTKIIYNRVKGVFNIYQFDENKVTDLISNKHSYKGKANKTTGRCANKSGKNLLRSKSDPYILVLYTANQFNDNNEVEQSWTGVLKIYQSDLEFDLGLLKYSSITCLESLDEIKPTERPSQPSYQSTKFGVTVPLAWKDGFHRDTSVSSILLSGKTYYNSIHKFAGIIFILFSYYFHIIFILFRDW